MECHEWSAGAHASSLTLRHGPRGYFRSECCTGGRPSAAARVKIALEPIHQCRARGWTARKYRFVNLRYVTRAWFEPATSFSGTRPISLVLYLQFIKIMQKIYEGMVTHCKRQKLSNTPEQSLKFHCIWHTRLIVNVFEYQFCMLPSCSMGCLILRRLVKNFVGS